jgi:hypothetical protein
MIDLNDLSDQKLNLFNKVKTLNTIYIDKKNNIYLASYN